MDDFYTACREKVQNSTDPAAAIDELVSISLRDLPQVQICKFTEQAVTLLSVIFQAANRSPQDLTVKFQQIRQQLSASLDCMEKVMKLEREFPHPQSDGDGCWW